MPTRYWLVDDTSIELIDRGQLGVTLVVGGARQAIPPMTLGAWPIAIAGRAVTLQARRNLDVVRYQLVSDDHLVPRRDHVAPASARWSRTSAPRSSDFDGSVSWCHSR